MFWYGSESHELVLCFKESKAKLIRAGAKAQNLPKSNEQAIDLLLSLSEDAMGIVRSWFHENVKFDKLRQPDLSLEILKTLPQNKTDSVELKDEWRSVLSLFSESNVPSILIEFLDGRDSTKKKPIVPNPPAEPLSYAATVVEKDGFFVTKEMIQACQKSFSEDSKIPAGNMLAALLEGAIAATKRDQTACKKAKDALVQVSGLLGPDLENLIRHLENNAARIGLRLRKAISSKNFETLDPELHSAVAEITKTLPSGQFFAKVIGMVVEQDFVEVSLEDARDLYPLAGEIIAFPNSITGHHHDGDLGVWRTDRLPTDKKNKFVIKSHVARVYEVVSVPHPSTDPDGVREWLLSSYGHSSTVLPIFELSDHLIIRLPGDIKDPRQFKYENPVDLYESLEAFEFSGGRRFVLGPMPVATQKLDLAQSITIIKRLLKIHEASEQFPAFSRQQVEALTNLIKDQKDYPISSSVSRVRERLVAVSDLKENLDEIITEMLSLPKVTKQLEVEKKFILQKFSDEQNEHLVELQKLKDAKVKLESEISITKKSFKSQEQQLVSLIKEKFQKAQQEGLETLAQSALFRGLIGYEHRTELPKVHNELLSIKSQLEGHDMGLQILSVGEMKTVLQRAAYATGFSAQLIAAVICSARTCGAVGLLGSKWEALAQVLSTVVAAGVRCTLSVSADMFSLSDLLRAPALIRAGNQSLGLPLGDFLHAQSSLGRSSVVELIGSNRVPPESYLPELIDLLRSTGSSNSVAWTDLRGQIKTTTLNAPVLLLLGYVSGKSTFTFDYPISNQVPIITIDTHWGDEPELDTSIEVKNCHLTSSAWRELGRPKELISAALTTDLNPRTWLSKALEQCDCLDPQAIAQVFLEAGRPNSTLSPDEGKTSKNLLVKQILEVMSTSSSKLFSKSIGD